MKADEYAERINRAAHAGEEQLRKALVDTVRDLAGEAMALFRQRGRRAAPGIARELDAKWRAICARCPGVELNPNGWREMLIARGGPEMAALHETRLRL